MKNEKTDKKCKEAKPPTPSYFNKARDLALNRGSDINCRDEITFKLEKVHIHPPFQVT